MNSCFPDCITKLRKLFEINKNNKHYFRGIYWEFCVTRKDRRSVRLQAGVYYSPINSFFNCGRPVFRLRKKWVSSADNSRYSPCNPQAADAASLQRLLKKEILEIQYHGLCQVPVVEWLKKYYISLSFRCLINDWILLDSIAISNLNISIKFFAIISSSIYIIYT